MTPTKMSKRKASAAAEELHCYMEFRAAREGVAYDLNPALFHVAIKLGCRKFFGVAITASGRIIGDEQNPEAFEAYQRERSCPH